MEFDTLLIYLAVSFFYIIGPGPAVFLAMSNGMSYNVNAVVISSLGNITGLFILSSISILGLGTLLLTSASLFLAVKMMGAFYLIFLGIKQFRASRSLTSKQRIDTFRKANNASYFREGLLVAVTNPKPILFFTALFPQFLNIDSAIAPQFFIMTIIFMAISFCSLLSYGLLAKSARHWFSNETKMAWFHKITGGLFISMGVGLLSLKNSHG